MLCAALLAAVAWGTPATELSQLLPQEQPPVLAVATALAPNGNKFCTRLETPVDAPPYLGTGANPTCVAVVAAYAQTKEELILLRLLIPPACSIVVYDKTDDAPCGFMPLAGVNHCISLPNVGREQHTFSHFVRTHYWTLPDVMFFTPADIAAHDRAHQIQLMLNSTVFNTTVPGGGIIGHRGGGFWCINASAGRACDGFAYQPPLPLSVCGNCSFTKYCRGGSTTECITPDPTAQPSLQTYFHANVGALSPSTMEHLCQLPLCHYGVAATTRENLLVHPKEVYANIEASLNQSVTGEAIWMMEWGMALVYGMGGAINMDKCHPGYPYPEKCDFQHHHV
mmetsp:Transcript_20879/g.36829  ORF Transcript_20879/g.36829 Transcript_20879/m.36829 type:complete len:339 (+) Transcript_20879:31-1047(+)